jgi:endonuclease YncB( thermonuclease family)
MLTENGTIRVRIYGIDAPEKSQAFGRVSKEYLSKLIGGISVKVLVSNKDRYGRYICRVYSEEKDISYEMLKAGLAWHYKRFDNSEKYSQAEKTAKTNKVGLWKDSNPIRPWQYRKKN